MAEGTRFCSLDTYTMRNYLSPSISLGNEATFLAKLNENMQLTSLRFSNQELLYRNDSEALSSGVIGPHYGSRKAAIIPALPKSFIPQPAAGNKNDPFPGGLGRYVAWESHTQNNERVQAVLKSDREWQGVPIKTLEGQAFQMTAHTYVHNEEFSSRFAVVSDGDSVTGLQLSFHLDPSFDSSFKCGARDMPDRKFETSFHENIDLFLHPFPSERKFELELNLKAGKFRLTSETICSEHSMHLLYNQGEPFFTVAFLSAKNPLHPNLSVSQLWMSIAPLL